METFRWDGLDFDVSDAGPPDGDTVVLLHGFPQDRHAFDAVAARLNERGWRTLAPDQRGYSPGARPPRRRDYRLPLLAGDVIALLDAAGVARAHVVGHDWGGAVAWSLASSHPGRLRTVTSLSTPHPAAMLRSLATSRQLLHSWYMFLFQLPGLPELLIDPSTPGRRRRWERSFRGSDLPPQAVARYADRAAEPGALRGMLAWYRAMFLGDPWDASRPVAVPALYVWSTRDAYLGRRAAELTERYVTGPYEFEVLDGADHWLPEGRPDDVARLVDGHLRALHDPPA